MKNRILILIPAIAMTVWLLGSIKAEVPKAAPSPEPRLEQVQRAEILGNSALRGNLLSAVVKDSPDTREARWLLGQIEREGGWMDYSDLPTVLASDKELALYRKIRKDYGKTFRDQLELANWCKKHKLLDREQAHLMVALELADNPDDPALRARLGQRFVNGDWRTQADIDKLQKLQVENRQNLKTWTPAIQKLSTQLASRRDDIRQQAKAELKAITDRDALPALENVLGNADLESARLLVEILGQFRSHQAADGLARLAVLSPWKAVRQEAVEQLRSRPYGAYVPELLASMRTPVAAKARLLVGGGGVHLWERFSSETQTARQVFDRQSSSRYVIQVPLSWRGDFLDDPNEIRVRDNTTFNNERILNRISRGRANSVLEAQLQTAQTQTALDAHNQEIENWNQRICEVLKEATGVQLPPLPTEWWDWWLDYNQLAKANKEYQYVLNWEVTLKNVTMVKINPSCLVAGTPIWTDRGAVPVEAVQVGDLALAKHPETGELNYRPVLRTTIREAQPVLKVTTPKGQIRGTGGHTFWISGRGWTKLRDVKPGQHFHGATGPVEIQSLEEEGIEKTYNLVVADVHTYFVGEDLILSHDVTIAPPVDAMIPGFVKP